MMPYSAQGTNIVNFYFFGAKVPKENYSEMSDLSKVKLSC